MSDYKRIQEMLYGLPNTQPVYTQKGTTTIDLDEMRAEIARLQAREAKLREAVERLLPCLDLVEMPDPKIDEIEVFARAALRKEESHE
jgi:predicted O-methyltransferase YrrM